MNMLLRSCHLNGLIQIKSKKHTYEQYYMKTLLNSFHFNGHKLGLHLIDD